MKKMRFLRFIAKIQFDFWLFTFLALSNRIYQFLKIPYKREKWKKILSDASLEKKLIIKNFGIYAAFYFKRLGVVTPSDTVSADSVCVRIHPSNFLIVKKTVALHLSSSQVHNKN